MVVEIILVYDSLVRKELHFRSVGECPNDVSQTHRGWAERTK